MMKKENGVRNQLSDKMVPDTILSIKSRSIKVLFQNNFEKKQQEHFFLYGRSLKDTETMTPG